MIGTVRLPQPIEACPNPIRNRQTKSKNNEIAANLYFEGFLVAVSGKCLLEEQGPANKQWV